MADIIGSANGQDFWVGSPPVTSPAPGATTTPTTTTTSAAPFSNIQPTSSTVTTSAPVQGAVNNLGNNITNAASNPPTTPGVATTPITAPLAPAYDPAAATAANDAANASIEARRTALQQERDSEVARITADFNTQQQNQEQAAKGESASSNRNLLYLQQGGQSASAQAYLNALEQTHTQEMQTLLAKRESAIAVAKNAYSEKDFTLAQQELTNAKDLEKEIYTRNQDFLDNTLKIRGDIRADQTQQFQKQQNDLAQVKEANQFAKDNGINDAFYQYPGSSTVYDTHTGLPITAAQYSSMGGKGDDYSDIQVLQPKDNTQHSTSFIEWQDYARTGGKLSFNDYMNMDANRKATKVTNNTFTYDQAKDQAQTQAASVIGSTFASLMGPDDKYVSPGDYKKGLSKWTSAGYSAADFNKQFMNYINPADIQDYGVTK